MAQKTIQGSETLAKQIKSRRNNLGLTIAEAASRAGVGIKTWSRYEAGESIRKDKCKGICKALNWNSFPDQFRDEDISISIQEYKNHIAWSPDLETRFGTKAAMSFAAGSDILLDYIEEDMSELASMPAGSHIGQLDISLLYGDLPEQFLIYYDYNFLYQLKCTLCQLRLCAKYSNFMVAHSVMEELIFYLCSRQATFLIELIDDIDESDEDEDYYSDEWIFDLFGDMDIITYLYSNIYLTSDDPYHFSHWNEQQFFIEHLK